METLNIGSGFDDLRARELSNFMIRPFVLDGVKARSVEGFLHGIKFAPGDPRREETFAMAGLKAKRMGEQALRVAVWWKDETIPYNAEGHRALLERAIRASFEQNPVAMLLLRSTRGMKLTHDLGTPERPDTCLPAHLFCDILMRLRDEWDLRDQRRMAEEHGWVPALSLADAHDIARAVERHGVDARLHLTAKYGRDLTLMAAVMHLRRAFGATSFSTAGDEARVTKAATIILQQANMVPCE